MSESSKDLETLGLSVIAMRRHFEQMWQQDKSPHIESVLAEAGEADQPAALRALLAVEIKARRERGDVCQVDDYQQRFPGHHELVAEVFESFHEEEFATVGPSSPGSTVGLQVRCPHCRHALELSGDAALSQIDCPSCGSRFSLTDPQTSDGGGVRRFVGHFELLDKLGAGAFGTVWKARDSDLERLVAVKIPRRGQLDPQEMELFLREARTAAQLRHPNIVGVHEVGRDVDKVYIVSDLIDGISLDQWVSTHPVSARDAAELCLKVASALQHAHEHGVIHRDLKPQNILIDSQAEPHVTDFGLARREAGEVTMTMDGELLGTPAYMSPEQAQGAAHSADGRSDVYSLGVLLYELLTGEKPFRGSVQMVILQVINDEPQSPRKLSATVARDLETIVLKCLEKERSKRYASARKLADDLSHYLVGRPIEARPVGRADRFRRWCLRNPIVAGLSAVAVALLATVACVATIGYVQTSRALAEKEVAATTATRVSQFLTNLFRSSDPLGVTSGSNFTLGPRNKEDANLTAGQLLIRGAERVEKELAGEPLIQASLMETLGGVHLAIGQYPDAVKLQRKALQLRQTYTPEDTVHAATAMHNLAFALHFSGEFDEAEQCYRQALAMRKEALGVDNISVADTMEGLGLLMASKSELDEAESLIKESIAIRRRVLDRDDRQVGLGLAALASVYLSQGSTEQAEQTVGEAIAILYETDPEGGDLAGKALMKYQEGIVKSSEGDYQAAEPILGECVQMMSEVFGGAHPFVAWCMFDHGQALAGLGRRAEAIAVTEDALEMAELYLAPKHPELLGGRRMLASLYFDEGNAEKAAAILQDARRTVVKAYGEQSLENANYLRDLAVVLSTTERRQEAEELAAEALDIVELLPPDSRPIWSCRNTLAECQLKNGRPAAAIETLADVDEAMASVRQSPTENENIGSLMRACETLGEAQIAAGEFDAAKRTMRDAIACVEIARPESGIWPARYRLQLGTALMETAALDAAEKELLMAHDAFAKGSDEDDDDKKEAAELLHRLYVRWNKPHLAVKYAHTATSAAQSTSAPATVESAR